MKILPEYVMRINPWKPSTGETQPNKSICFAQSRDSREG